MLSLNVAKDLMSYKGCKILLFVQDVYERGKYL